MRYSFILFYLYIYLILDYILILLKLFISLKVILENWKKLRSVYLLFTITNLILWNKENKHNLSYSD